MAEWQTLQVASSATLATPPVLMPSLLDEPHPLNNAAQDNALNSRRLNFLILIAFLLG
jgi:hypothetical protein